MVKKFKRISKRVNAHRMSASVAQELLATGFPMTQRFVRELLEVVNVVAIQGPARVVSLGELQRGDERGRR